MEVEPSGEQVASNSDAVQTDFEKNDGLDASEPSNNTGSLPGNNRRVRQKRSIVWKYFDEIKDASGIVISAECRRCKKVYAAHSSRNGTTILKNHIDSHTCKSATVEDTTQNQLNFQPVDGGVDGAGTLTNWKFDQDEIRDVVSYMIVVDELPFKFVEGEGFKRFMSKACPRFKIPSRWTISRDCFQVYAEERTKLKSFFRSNCQRVCLTTDTWTSVQKINYMCLTVHFIDNDWNLHKKIINFVPVTSHRGEYLGTAMEMCILDWGLQNVFTVTLDNASSNDTAIAYLRKKIINWGGCVSNCKFLQMRCIAHIINLIVSEGLKYLSLSVQRVRTVVRYIRNSTARFAKFKECVKLEKGTECKSSLCLDVSTRWNSTYLMLKTAAELEKAFERYAEHDQHYKTDLAEAPGNPTPSAPGIPTTDDWIVVRKIANALKYFYEMTLRISGSLYVTSHTFFNEISDMCCILNGWKESNDPDIKNLGTAMKTKFDKYWGDLDMNKLIFFANVFDPRDKLEYMQYSLNEMYGSEKGSALFRSVRNDLFVLFEEYKNKYQPKTHAPRSSTCNLSSSSSDSGITDFGSENSAKLPVNVLKAKFKRQKLESGSGRPKKIELELYFDEASLEDSEDLDVLKWWKVNSGRFPILSKMARDILAVPISSVASESAFSTGGRVLNDFRSSLTPKIVEALICAQDWLRDSNKSSCVEELQEEIENFEKELPDVGIGSTLSNTNM